MSPNPPAMDDSDGLLDEPGASSPVVRNEPGGGNLRWHHVWTAVLAANMIVPMMFAKGMSSVGEGAHIGMGLAVGLLWLIGDLAGVRSLRIRRALTWGGAAVALSQALPILQVVAGVVGLGLVRRLFRLRGDEFGFIAGKMPESAVFLATFLTGGLLFFAAYVAGLILLPLVPGGSRDGNSAHRPTRP